MYQVFIGTNSVRGSRGIYTLSLTGAGDAAVTHTTPAYNTGYVSLGGGRLFAVSEGMTFQGQASGGVMAYDIAPDGALTLTGTAVAGGQRPCCLSAHPDGSEVYVSNFYGGLMQAFPVAPDGALLPPRLRIDEEPTKIPMKALHCVGLLPDGKTLGVVSLGRMSLLLYDAATGERLAEYAPEGHPRHFASSPDGRFLYLLMQMPAELHVLARTPDGPVLRQIVTLAERILTFGASAVRVTPDGQFVLAAMRDDDTLHVLRVTPEGLAPHSICKLPGRVPRDFAISPDGRFVVTALQYSDQVSVHRFEDGQLTLLTVLDGIPSPASVAIREVEV